MSPIATATRIGRQQPAHGQRTRPRVRSARPDLRDFAELHAQGVSVRQAAARLGVGRNVAERAYRTCRTAAAGPPDAPAGLAGLTPPQVRSLARLVVTTGRCAQAADPPDMFADPADLAAVAAATSYCASCPVTGECRRLAAAYGIEHGVWGGVLLDHSDAAPPARKENP